MKKILFALALASACADDPYTLDDAASDWATDICSRQVRCGFIDITYEQCVPAFHDFICDAWDCSVEYPYGDELHECLDEYRDLSCEVPKHLCTVYGPPYGPGPGETTTP